MRHFYGMLPTQLSAFFQELAKIATAGDLMNPAVVSDSATVDGPPATPFTRRKGYRKLERTGPTKEAGLKEFLQMSARTAKKVPDTANMQLAKLYFRAPRVVRNTIHDAVANPGDAASSLGSVLKHVPKLLGH